MAVTDIEIEVDNQEYLTIKQVSHVTRISVPTLRRYIRDYKQCLEIKRGTKNKTLFSRKVIEKVITISHLVRAGNSREEVIKSIGMREYDQSTTDTKNDLIPAKQGAGAVSHEVGSLMSVIKEMQNQIELYQGDREKIDDTHEKFQELSEELALEKEKNRNLEGRLKKQEQDLDVIWEWIDNQSLWKAIKKVFGFGKKE
ncbi:MerR family transcriptional regulator [bacterium]|jgi:DNA-binding transcriptional MerR regulator|nr:MerR family transcriptional regulator [bacterium]